MVKLYLQKHPNTEILALYDLNNSRSDLVESAQKNINDDNRYNINIVELPRWNLACTQRLPTRFQHMANISIFIKNNIF